MAKISCHLKCKFQSSNHTILIKETPHHGEFFLCVNFMSGAGMTRRCVRWLPVQPSFFIDEMD